MRAALTRQQATSGRNGNQGCAGLRLAIVSGLKGAASGTEQTLRTDARRAAMSLLCNPSGRHGRWALLVSARVADGIGKHQSVSPACVVHGANATPGFREHEEGAEGRRALGSRGSHHPWAVQDSVVGRTAAVSAFTSDPYRGWGRYCLAHIRAQRVPVDSPAGSGTEYHRP